jgi:hypothetical protein
MSVGQTCRAHGGRALAHLIGLIGSFLAIAPVAALAVPVIWMQAAWEIWLVLCLVGLALIALAMRLLREEAVREQRPMPVSLDRSPAELVRMRRFI